MLKCDQPERPKKTYTIPKVSKKRQAAIDAGTWQPKPKQPIKVNQNYKIPNRSKRRAAQEVKYLKAKQAYLRLHDECEAKLIGCTFRVDDLHHKGKRVENDIFDKSMFMAICRNCHNKIHFELSKKEALELNLLI